MFFPFQLPMGSQLLPTYTPDATSTSTAESYPAHSYPPPSYGAAQGATTTITPALGEELYVKQADGQFIPYNSRPLVNAHQQAAFSSAIAPQPVQTINPAVTPACASIPAPALASAPAPPAPTLAPALSSMVPLSSGPAISAQPDSTSFAAAASGAGVVQSAAAGKTPSAASMATPAVPHLADSRVGARSATDVVPEGRVSRTAAATPLAESFAWDPFIDGYQVLELTLDQHESCKAQVHWAMQTGGGPTSEKQGTQTSTTWEGGFYRRRRCLGAIHCNNPNCSLVGRPATEKAVTAKRVAELCRCGSSRRLIPCDVELRSWQYRDGVHLVHTGTHHHGRPLPIHLTQSQRIELFDQFSKNPDKGPLALAVGHSGQDGVTSISPLLHNLSKVKAEKREYKRENTASFPREFSQFDTENPGVIVASQFSSEMVISMQTPYMRQQLVRVHTLASTVNGIVTDAAHKFWREKNTVLIISSVYSDTLHRWIPALITYANGQTAGHYAVHFETLFQSMQEECAIQGRILEDDMLANVVDFSEAQRLGFIQAYIAFRANNVNDLDDEFLVKELEGRAERLLKGCQQHFRAQVTRVSAISGVVSADQREDFKRRAGFLLDVNSYETFQGLADDLLRDFPNIKPWLEWWMRPVHAQMLFRCDRVMDEGLWEAIPDTTNAQESLHHKMYTALGAGNFSLLDGLRSLLRMAQFFEGQHSHVEQGGKITYGDPEPWKTAKAADGLSRRARVRLKELLKKKSSKDRREKAQLAVALRTKRRPLAHPRNDGRPKDTAKQLIPQRAQTQGSNLSMFDDASTDSAASITEFDSPALSPSPVSSQHRSAVPDELAGLRWLSNSCWLDAGLQALYYAITCSDHFNTSFVPRVDQRLLPHSESSPIHEFFRLIIDRYSAEHSGEDTVQSRAELEQRLDSHTAQFTNRRDLLRSSLVQSGTISASDSIFFPLPWLWTELRQHASLIGPPFSRGGITAQHTYFASASYKFRRCSGAVKGAKRMPHYQLAPHPRLSYHIELPNNRADAARYEFDISRVFKDFLKLPTKQPHFSDSSPCWRKRDDDLLCEGATCTDPDIVLSIPVVLAVTLNGVETAATRWSVPEHLYPHTRNTEDQSQGLVYDIVSMICFERKKEHYWVLFTPDGKAVYKHDGMHHRGRSILLPHATVGDTLAKTIDITPASDVWPQQIIYRLRGGSTAQQLFYNRRVDALESAVPDIILSQASGPWPESILSDSPPHLPYLPTATMHESRFRRVPLAEQDWRVPQRILVGDGEVLEYSEDPFGAFWEYVPVASVDHSSSSPVKAAKRRRESTASTVVTACDDGDTILPPLNKRSRPLTAGHELAEPAVKRENRSARTRKDEASSTSRHRARASAMSSKSVRVVAKSGRVKDPGASSSPRPQAGDEASEVQAGDPPAAPSLDAFTGANSKLPSDTSDTGDEEQSRMCCRCGLTGDADELLARADSVKHGPVIQCDICRAWSHMACQRDGFASLLQRSQSFKCDNCSLAPLLPQSSNEGAFYDGLKSKAKKRGGVKSRLTGRIGQGCLIRDNTQSVFWYPARIIDYDSMRMEWTVMLWRGRHFCPSETKRGLLRTVALPNIVDELWQQREERRKIRVEPPPGWESLDAEDIITSFRDFPFTTAIDKVLKPHRALLTDMLLDGLDSSSAAVQASPCMIYLKEQSMQKSRDKLTIAKGSIPLEGPLSPEERARIANWIWCMVPGAQEGLLALEWLGKATMAHAELLVIAANRQISLEDAWSAKKTERWSSRRAQSAVDVDLECLRIFERKLFEKSEASGPAGNWQWGLDAGPHQHGWNPDMDYTQCKGTWTKGDTEEDELDRLPGDGWKDASAAELQCEPAPKKLRRSGSKPTQGVTLPLPAFRTTRSRTKAHELEGA
uniref:PHD-type domain-containing protein n=1 Tax=Schizophyllum commune (strain H4-8 / FGSC 9210) TaxID=578458 RepID=D8PWE0_SCHCM